MPSTAAGTEQADQAQQGPAEDPAKKRIRWAVTLAYLGVVIGLVVATRSSLWGIAGFGLALSDAVAGNPLKPLQRVVERLFAPGRPGLADFYLGLNYSWLKSAGLIALVLLAERGSLRSMGIIWGDPAQWVIAAGIGLGLVAVASTAMSALARRDRAGNPSHVFFLSLPLPNRVFLVATAAVTEEVIYRGYQMQHVAAYTGHIWLAGAIVGGFFVLGHIAYFDWRTMLGATLPASIALIVYFALTRNLPATMLIHAIIDGFFILAGPALAKAKARKAQGPR